MNHTPGPWKFKTDRVTGDCGLRAEGTGIFAEAFADVRHAGEGARDEALANAKLIAAAPDLLAALKAADEADRADERYEEMSRSGDPDDECNIDDFGDFTLELHAKAKKLRAAAIAKATGGEA